VNVAGTKALLDACKAAGVRRFIHFSTIAAGYPDKRYSRYAKSKAEAEAIVRESGLDFVIIRPTIVLGERSPIWLMLKKIAKLPLVPLPQSGKGVSVQPIHVDDVVRGVELIMDADRFEGETLELGGPNPLSFWEFIAIIQRASGVNAGRSVSIPLMPLRMALAFVEPVLRPLMPVTAGQLSVFANDSTVLSNWLHDRLRDGMPTTEQTIARLLAPATGEGDSESGNDRALREAPHMAAEARRILEKECSVFSAHLIGVNTAVYTRLKYVEATSAHGIAFDENFSPFDRATLAFARRGRNLARWADAYCAIFHRRGVLRRKLIVLAAILEHVSPTSHVFDNVPARGRINAILALVGSGSMFALSLALGVIVLLPLDLFYRAQSARTAGISNPTRSIN
jgi:hypothetical protein